jgi:hypothetical protein
MGPLLQGEAGFLVALLVITMLFRWLWAIRVVTAKQWVYDGQLQQRRKLLWALPIVLILHSGPWTVGVFGFLSWELIIAEKWAGYGWGLVAGVLLMTSLACATLARQRREAIAGRRLA